MCKSAWCAKKQVFPQEIYKEVDQVRKFVHLYYVKTIVSKYDGFHITYLHPSVLLQKTKFIVSNLYSTIFGDASSMGIPTLEYAYYPEYIKKDVGDESICPKYVDWFVYDDAEKFEKELDG